MYISFSLEKRLPEKFCDISAMVWPIYTKFGMIMQNVSEVHHWKKFQFKKSKMADGQYAWDTRSAT